MTSVLFFNPFEVNVSFLYLLKTDFLMFSVGTETQSGPETGCEWCFDICLHRL